MFKQARTSKLILFNYFKIGKEQLTKIKSSLFMRDNEKMQHHAPLTAPAYVIFILK